jgi:ADP-heptose:LPS heptosyltransferase
MLADGAPRRVAIFRALQLGDLLCAVPALRALRAAVPGAETVLVGLPWARGFVARFARYLDGFREFPGFPGLPEREPEIGRVPEFLAAMQAARFDLAIQLHGSGRFVNPLVALFGARRSAGFYLPGDCCPDPETFVPWPDRGLETRRLLSLMESLGAPSQGDDLEFPLDRDDFRSLSSVGGVRDLVPGEHVCIHPGASVAQRRWPVSRFSAVARALHGRDLQVVLTGTAAEAALTRAVAQEAAVPCLDLAGRTDLGALGALLARSRLLVCNDTGVSHVAAGLRTPSVVISTGDNPARWAPIDGHRHRVLCRESGVDAEEVVAEAYDLLETVRANAHEAPALIA